MDRRLKNAKRWVVKIGSALLTDNGRGLNRSALQGWAEQIAELTQQGREVVLVSSGAVAEGLTRLGITQRPHALHDLQAAAAVGQTGLIQAYETCFQAQGRQSAQILLTHADLSNRQRYLNARSTLRTLLNLGAIPIVNENDTVATDEIRFGDNDTLAALVANLIDADVLLILTDQPGLYDADPRINKNARLIEQAMAHDKTLRQYAGDAASSLSRGGMRTKIEAGRRAARSGTHTIIASGHEPQGIIRITAGEHLGTRLMADQRPLTARKQWIANEPNPKGQLHLDIGAEQAIRDNGYSLLAVGITKVEGRFNRGDVVRCLSQSGDAITQGICNYNSAEIALVAGKNSDDLEEILGYIDETAVIHRDNLAPL